MGTTTIHWKAPGPTAAVYVLVHGASEGLFYEGAEGSIPANWIQDGLQYEFRLYTGRDRKTLLARVFVARTMQ